MGMHTSIIRIIKNITSIIPRICSIKGSKEGEFIIINCYIRPIKLGWCLSPFSFPVNGFGTRSARDRFKIGS